MLKLILSALALVAALSVLILVVSYIRYSGEIATDIGAVVANGGRASRTAVTAAMLDPLPEPAQRYFRYAGVIGQPIPGVVRLAQKGRIRSGSDANWMDFEADETYSVDSPGFVWRAWFPSPVLPIVLGRDEYLGGGGSIEMKMLALLPIADEHGDEMKSAGLMRYLNETMWFPAALLRDNITIVPRDKSSFDVALTDRGLTATATLFVDDAGRLINFRAQRYSSATRRIETWETPIVAYTTLAGLQLPSRGSAIWKLAGGDLDYIELEVTSVDYDPADGS